MPDPNFELNTLAQLRALRKNLVITSDALNHSSREMTASAKRVYVLSQSLGEELILEVARSISINAEARAKYILEHGAGLLRQFLDKER